MAQTTKKTMTEIIASYLAPSLQRSYSTSLGNSGVHKIEDKPLSDTLSYGSESQNRKIERQETMFLLGSRANKREQIARWTAHIEELSKQIEEIKIDNSLSEEEKQRKINRRLEIIALHKHTIADAQMFLDRYVTR